MAEIRYAVTVDSSGAVTSIQKLDDAFKKMQTEAGAGGREASAAESSWTKLFGTFTLASLAADAVRGAFRAIKNELKETLGAAIAQEDADRALSAALELTGRTLEGNVAHYKSFAEAQQQATIYADDQIQTSQALLIQMTKLNQEGIDKATKGAMGLASTLKMDLHAATMLIAKAMEGNFGALSRYGIRVDETLTLEEKRAVLLEKLNIMYGRAQAETETYSGRLAQLRNAWSDAQEEIGNAVVKNESVKQAMQDVTNLIREITPELKDYIEGLAGFIGGIAKAVSGAFKALQDVRERIGGMRSDVSEAEQAWDKLNIKLGGFTGVVQDVSQMILILGKHSAESRDIVAGLGEKLWDSFNEIGGRATLAAIASGKFGEETRKALEAAGGWSYQLAVKLNEVGAVVDEVGPKISGTAKKSEAELKFLQERAAALSEEMRQFRNFSVIDVDTKQAVTQLRTFGDVIGGTFGKLVDFKEPVGDVFDFLNGRVGQAAGVLTKLDIRKQLDANRKALALWGDAMPVDEVVRLRQEVAELKRQLAMPDWLAAWKTNMASFSTYATAAISGFNAIISQAQANREIEIENEYKKRLDIINATYTNEEERQRAITALEAEFEIKRTSAKRVAAKQQKAVALLGAVVNTAEAVTEALPNIFLAALVGAMGAVQIGLIARQPIPLAKGAIFEGATQFMTQGGRLYEAGEAGREILGSEDAIRRIFREEAGRASRRRPAGPLAVVINVDGRKLAEALLPNLESLSGRGRLTMDIQTIVRSEQ
jgi:hypothetical protein